MKFHEKTLACLNFNCWYYFKQNFIANFYKNFDIFIDYLKDCIFM